jgi:DNA-binding transcriptional LysR family regulator
MIEDSTNPNDLGIDLLRTFVTVVETRNYSKAATLLGLSQPTVSSHVKRLQQQLNAALFDKSNPGVQLTPQGMTVLDYARRILSLAEELNRQLDRQDTPSADIRIGISNEVRWNIVTILAELRNEDQDLNFRTHRGSSGELLERIGRGELDICAVTQNTEMSVDALLRWRENLVWAAAPARERELVGPIDIVAPPASCACRAIMLSALERAKMDFQIRFDASDLDEAIEAAADGLGYIALLRSNVPSSMHILPTDFGLPAMRDFLYRGVYLNPVTRTASTERLAHLLAQTVAPGNSDVGETG